MDESKEYIKMCEKALEIQKLCNYCDCIYFHKKEGILYGDDYIEESIWLPRQDQLQELVKSDCTCGSQWLHQGVEIEEFGNYLCDLEGERDLGCLPNYKSLIDMSEIHWKIHELACGSYILSWEQFWLAFVMHKKFNKIWDGRNWILEVKLCKKVQKQI